MYRISICVSIAVLFSSCLTGCGAKNTLSGLVPAGGSITYNSKPIDGATVNFIPVDQSSGKRSAVATTDTGGTFVMRTLHPNDGVAPGEYKVTVTKIHSEEQRDKDGKSLGPGSQSPAAVKHLVPAKYASPNTSGLVVTIGDKGKTDIVFELTD